MPFSVMLAIVTFGQLPHNCGGTEVVQLMTNIKVVMSCLIKCEFSPDSTMTMDRM